MGGAIITIFIITTITITTIITIITTTITITIITVLFSPWKGECRLVSKAHPGCAGVGERRRGAGRAGEMGDEWSGGWEDGGLLKRVLSKGQQLNLVAKVGGGPLAAAL